MKREFTGRDMAMILVGGFAIVIAVNLLMATLATRGFGGVVVQNSYVASQKFNQWLETAREQEGLGWSADIRRQDDGRLAIATGGVPAGALVTARLRRPLGEPESRDLAFAATGDGAYIAADPIPDGRWIARVTIESGADRWTDEVRIE